MPLILVFLMGACELATLENKVFHRLAPESTSTSSIILQFSSLMSLMRQNCCISYMCDAQQYVEVPCLNYHVAMA